MIQREEKYLMFTHNNTPFVIYDAKKIYVPVILRQYEIDKVKETFNKYNLILEYDEGHFNIVAEKDKMYFHFEYTLDLKVPCDLEVNIIYDVYFKTDATKSPYLKDIKFRGNEITLIDDFQTFDGLDCQFESLQIDDIKITSLSELKLNREYLQSVRIYNMKLESLDGLPNKINDLYLCGCHISNILEFIPKVKYCVIDDYNGPSESDKNLFLKKIYK